MYVFFDVLDNAVAQVDYLVSNVGHAAFVGYNDYGHAVVVKLPQELHYFDRCAAVEGACRLVGKYYLRLRDDCPGYCNPLFLSARELVGHVVGVVSEPEAFEVFHGQHVAPLAAYALVHERERHVFERVLERNEVERLEHEADKAVAVVGRLVLAQVLDGRSGERVFAAVVSVEYAHDVEQCGLSRTRSSHYRHELALPDVERNAFEHVQFCSVVVSLVDVF